ncbi:Hypothetical protein PHPALM_17306 [Phytophthora palmivora]|uniref:Uncharacterized protein n=1 Tax=Phytophthora palmivora TaxID=4796 RepID=A0A2P4XMI9_9STRA|nr:Hypothetical protein PHPALM_17306 [Phytophthora palmivora]
MTTNGTSTQNLLAYVTSTFRTSTLAPCFIAFERHSNSAYALDLPLIMRLHPTFYVGHLKPYLQSESPSSDDPSMTRSTASVRGASKDP